MYFLCWDYNHSQPDPYGGFYIAYISLISDSKSIVEALNSRVKDGNMTTSPEELKRLGKKYKKGSREDRIAIFKSDDIVMDIRLAMHACQALDEYTLALEWTEVFDLLQDRLDIGELIESDPYMKQEFGDYPKILEEMRDAKREMALELEGVLEKTT